MFELPFAQVAREQAELLQEIGVRVSGTAVDLGCGSGFQSVALAMLGASSIHAIDQSPTLLSELAANVSDYPITIHNGDLLEFDQLIGEPVDCVLCMGDTLTHLGSHCKVQLLFAKVARSLRSGGQLVLTWRDLSHPPEGLDRIIPVRADDERVMVCFLEDCGERILVHDTVHVRCNDGWTFEKSSYAKLKLSVDWVANAARNIGLTTTHVRTVRGLSQLCASK